MIPTRKFSSPDIPLTGVLIFEKLPRSPMPLISTLAIALRRKRILGITSPHRFEAERAPYKGKLVARLRTQLNLRKQESRQVTDRVLQVMKPSLARGEDVLISRFGRFSVRQKNPRRGRRPHTKEPLILPARKRVVFKSSRVLRDLIKES